MDLKSIRLESNLKVAGMCNLLGCPRNRYFQLENGKAKLTTRERRELNIFLRSDFYARISGFGKEIWEIKTRTS